VHQRRRLQRVIPSLAPQVCGSHSTQIGIDHGHQRLERRAIASRCAVEEAADLARLIQVVVAVFLGGLDYPLPIALPQQRCP
jgi:hypothetical protein